MRYSVRELPRAKSDKRQILEWILGRSPQGGRAWLNAYDEAIALLERNAEAFGEASENRDCPLLDVKQTFFKTKRGRVYRLLYFIEDTTVFVLRVRGPGQPPLTHDELQT